MICRITIILIALALSACSATPTATPTPKPTPQPTSAYFVEYSRTGGIAGINDHLKISSNGHATLARRSANFEFDMTSNELNRLQLLFRDAGFATIPEDSMSKTGLVSDEISYTVSYQGHTVKTSDTAMPKALQLVIALLNGIIDAKGK